MSDRSDRSFRLFLAAAAALAGMFVAMLRARVPEPVPADAPPGVFSAARAMADLRELLGDGSPHPIGSAAAKAVRERLLAKFRSLGMTAEVQRDFVVAAGQKQAAWVENVVAVLPGARTDAPPVVIACHSDSVGAGSGAADDGIGMAAAIETVRVLRASPPLAAAVHVLVTDGEEAGLLGARAFVRRKPGPIAAIVNVEARGNSGPMLMFETAGPAGDLVSAWASAAPRPTTGSLFDVAYRLLPNSTDVAVLRNLDGVPILNFACIGTQQHYHTPLDHVDHLDPGTLQHAGDSVLAAVRAAAQLAESEPSGRDLVWHDVLGLAVLRWPASWSLPFAVLLLAAHVAVAWSALRRDGRGLGSLAGGVFATLLAWLAGIAASWGVLAALRASGAIDRPVLANPGWAASALAGAAVWGGVMLATALSRRLSGATMEHASGPFFAVLAVALAAVLPAVSPLFTIASFALLAVAVAARTTGGRREWIGATAAPFAAAALFASLAGIVADGFGVAGAAPGLPVAIPLLGVISATAAVPFVAVAAGSGSHGLVAAGATLTLAVAGSIGVAAAPSVTPDRPGKLSFLYRADASEHHAHVMLLTHGEPLPESILAKLETEPDPERILPWVPAKAVAAEAPAVEVPAPALEDLRKTDLGGGRRVSFRLRSQREASDLVLVVEPSARVRRLTVNGSTAPAEGWRDDRMGYLVRLFGVPPEGVSIEIDIAAAAEFQAYVGDVTPGLPPACDRILEARPATHVPAHQGDTTVTVRRLRL